MSKNVNNDVSMNPPIAHVSIHQVENSKTDNEHYLIVLKRR